MNADHTFRPGRPAADFPASTFADRRARVARALGEGVLVLSSAPTRYRSRDSEHRYRPDSELFWLTGVAAPDVVAVLRGGDEPRLTLFAPERDETVELWSGPRPGPGEMRERHAADEAHPFSRLEEVLPELLAGSDRIFWRLGGPARVEGLVREALERGRARGPRTGTGPRGVVDPGEVLDDFRVVKDAEEIRRLRLAAEISMAGHRAGMAAAAAGVGEWAVEAAVEGAFRAAGAAGPGFATIVGAGANACVLHYVANADTLEAGDLVLVDAGAEVGLYNGDITRTWPVAGAFTDRQRAVYEVVDAARARAVEAVAPGATVADVHDAAVRVLAEGLRELGVVKGSVASVVEEGAWRSFFPHQTSHWLGLDVHDPGDYARDGASRILEPGMVLTVEPGLYFRAGLEGGGAWEGIGVRIEDDVLVTPDGRENLTGALPTDPDAVAELVGAGRR